MTPILLFNSKSISTDLLSPYNGTLLSPQMHRLWYEMIFTLSNLTKNPSLICLQIFITQEIQNWNALKRYKILYTLATGLKLTKPSTLLCSSSYNIAPAWQHSSMLNMQTFGAAFGLCDNVGQCGAQATIARPYTVHLCTTNTVWFGTSSEQTKRHWRKWLKKPRRMNTHKLQLPTSKNKTMEEVIHR